jgi:hypothetical protein
MGMVTSHHEERACSPGVDGQKAVWAGETQVVKMNIPSVPEIKPQFSSQQPTTSLGQLSCSLSYVNMNESKEYLSMFVDIPE